MILTNPITPNSVVFQSELTSNSVNNVTDPLYTYLDSISNRSITSPITTNYTIQSNIDYVVPVNASSNFTITFPDGATQRNSITIFRTDNNFNFDVTLACAGTNQVANNTEPGVSSSIILRAQERIVFMFSGGTWNIVDRHFSPKIKGYFNRAGLTALNFSQLNSATSSVVPNWNVVEDTYNMYNVSTKRFIIPTEGFYSFNLNAVLAKVSGGNVDNPIYIQLRKLGTVNNICYDSIRTTQQPIGYRVSATGTAYLNRGDEISVQIGDGGFTGQTMSVNADTSNNLSIMFVK